MPRLSPIRRDSRLRRRAGNRPPRSVTLIVCEGETEREYLAVLCNRLGLLPTEVILAENTGGSAPISVVACAERRATERGGYDHIFCVFDRDSHESFERARSRIRDRHMPDYVKAKVRVANALVDCLDAALASAAWLEVRAEGNNWNPYTQVHQLVAHLRAVAAQED